MTYLLTFTCFGSHMPGQRSGIVSRKRNRYTDPFVDQSPALLKAVGATMIDQPYVLDLKRAHAVLEAMLETCTFRQWNLYAVHVRTNHVHVVINGKEEPERMLTDLKAYASRS